MVRNAEALVSGGEVAVDLDAASLQAGDLLEQSPRINHDTVADDADFAGMQDAGRNQVQDVLIVADLDRVSGVIAALITDDHIGLLGQHVDDLAFAFITPLRPH